MKAILEFNLPEDQSEYELANRAGKLHCFVYDLACWVRQKYKYEEVDSIDIEELQDKLGELYDEHDVSPYGY